MCDTADGGAVAGGGARVSIASNLPAASTGHRGADADAASNASHSPPVAISGELDAISGGLGRPGVYHLQRAVTSVEVRKDSKDRLISAKGDSDGVPLSL